MYTYAYNYSIYIPPLFHLVRLGFLLNVLLLYDQVDMHTRYICLTWAEAYRAIQYWCYCGRPHYVGHAKRDLCKSAPYCHAQRGAIGIPSSSLSSPYIYIYIYMVVCRGSSCQEQRQDRPP